MNAPNNNLRVAIWDLGPKKPELPTPPTKPANLKPGSAEEVLAESDFQAAMTIYANQRDDFARLQRSYVQWQKLYEGPYQIDMWSVNAHEAMSRDPERYVDRLPKGVKPGRYHAEMQERRRQDAADMEAARNLDPQFGPKGVFA